MMTPATQQALLEDRADAVAELARLQQELPALEAEHAAAVTAARNLSAVLEDLRATVKRIKGPLSNRLSRRLAEARTALDTASGLKARLAGQIEGLRNRISDAKSDIRQIDGLLPRDANEEAA